MPSIKPTNDYGTYGSVDTVAPEGGGGTEMGVRATPEDFGSQVGGAVEAAGASGFEHAMKFQELDNQTNATQAESGYINKASDIYAQYRSTEGSNTYDAYPQFKQDLEKARLDTRSSLNPMAAKMFDASTLSHEARYIQSGSLYAADQRKEWVNQTADNNIDLQIRTVGSFANDEHAIGTTMGKIQYQVEQQGKLHGWPEEKTQEELNKKTVQLVQTVVGAKISGGTSPQDAMDWARSFKLPQNQENFIEDGIKPTTDGYSADQTAGRIMAGHDTIDLDAMKKAQAKEESGNGKSLVGSEIKMDDGTTERALGVYQIRPSVAKTYAARLGVPFDEDQLRDNPAYNEKIYNAITADNVKRYAANPTLVAFAYHNGADGADKMIKRFGTPGQDVTPEEWLNKVEGPCPVGAGYTRKVLGDCPPVKGTVPANGDVGQYKDDFMDQVKKMTRTLKDMDPVYAKTLEMVTGTKISQIQKGIEQTASQTRDTVLSAISDHMQKNDGAAPAPNQLPQEAQTAWASMKPEEQEKTLSMIHSLSKNEGDGLNPDRLKKLNYFDAMFKDPTQWEAAQNIDWSDPKNYKDLTMQDIDSYRGKQMSISKDDAKAAASGAIYNNGWKQVADYVQPLARQDALMGKKGDEPESMVTQFKSQFINSVDQWRQENNNKMPTTKVYRDIAAELNAPMLADRGSFHSDVPFKQFQTEGDNLSLYNRQGKLKKSADESGYTPEKIRYNIPATDRKSLLSSSPIKNPTEEQLQIAYKALLIGRRRSQ